MLSKDKAATRGNLAVVYDILRHIRGRMQVKQYLQEQRNRPARVNLHQIYICISFVLRHLLDRAIDYDATLHDHAEQGNDLTSLRELRVACMYVGQLYCCGEGGGMMAGCILPCPEH